MLALHQSSQTRYLQLQSALIMKGYMYIKEDGYSYIKAAYKKEGVTLKRVAYNKEGGIHQGGWLLLH